MVLHCKAVVQQKCTQALLPVSAKSPPRHQCHSLALFPQGYAFVQFTSPFDARSACLGEDAKSLCGQTLDVNMVSEPKAHISKVKSRIN